MNMHRYLMLTCLLALSSVMRTQAEQVKLPAKLYYEHLELSDGTEFKEVSIRYHTSTHVYIEKNNQGTWVSSTLLPKIVLEAEGLESLLAYESEREAAKALEESQKAKGLVKYKGEWLPSDVVADRQDRERAERDEELAQQRQQQQAKQKQLQRAEQLDLEQAYKLAYKMAVVATGSQVQENGPITKRFALLIHKLDKKFKEDKETICDITVLAQQRLKDIYSVDIGLESILTGIDTVMIKEIRNQSYAEYMAAYVTMRSQGSTHAETIEALRSLISTLLNN